MESAHVGKIDTNALHGQLAVRKFLFSSLHSRDQIGVHHPLSPLMLKYAISSQQHTIVLAKQSRRQPVLHQREDPNL
jgi:hypothetical protein